MSEFSAPYARHYDLLYADKDYAAEAAYIRDLLKRWTPGGTRLLELGSGTGRHANLLAGMGYSVHGVERSAAMLEAASRGRHGLPVQPRRSAHGATWRGLRRCAGTVSRRRLPDDQ